MSHMVFLLRGINVGGRARVPMAELRETLGDLGLTDVETYLQSGNVAFAAPSDDPEDLVGTVEAALADRFGFEIRVLLRTHGDLAAVVADNPFLARASGPKSLHVAFLAAAPPAQRVDGLDPDRSPPDAFAVAGREIYLHYPNGAGRSKLTLDYLERQLGTVGTARHWNTVTRLASMTAP
ncbi:DUF1697 domain-containing protein [Egibacter rhizosphaerae]|uniref:DUF1697 domain-containing protein n=1 Tax=Egibacter rhizosphaerae TaxID=1670831 RepID=A0A411YCB0_9ACTN|nr:DUF1697 domain-containing protein [Egibacter rhizosphaerae]QBI18840.1 DUF1697 domain-containing protein [Egibacter rhizosphaerae]